MTEYERTYRFPAGDRVLTVYVDALGDITVDEPTFHLLAMSAGFREI